MFVDDLSTWYVRRSRRRFREGDPAALATLHEALRVVTLCLAPFTPFPDDDALGVVPPSFSAETFRRTMTDAVVPGLERFGIAAGEAWQRRSLG